MAPFSEGKHAPRSTPPTHTYQNTQEHQEGKEQLQQKNNSIPVAKAIIHSYMQPTQKKRT